MYYENMEEYKYDKILKHIENLAKYYDATICIKDFSGFISQNPTFHTLFSPYMIHDKPYCRYVKSDTEAMMYCQSQIPQIIKKCHQERCSFIGTCHAGMKEIVVPIIKNSHIIGAILFGCYKPDNPPKTKTYQRVNTRFNNLSLENLKSLYENTTQIPELKTLDLIISSLELIANEIVLLDEVKLQTNNESETNTNNQPYDHMVINAIEYIKTHITEKITLDEIATYCNYSTSYLSHHFKKVVGVNVNHYINRMKVEYSKDYLIRGDDTLAKIAEDLGFSDVSYYSRMFTRILGIAPGKFRDKYKGVVNTK